MTATYQPYFLSLTLSNVRCFAAPQTLQLTQPDGRPARFTFLLGENGTGKTTLLQMLACLRPERLLGFDWVRLFCRRAA